MAFRPRRNSAPEAPQRRGAETPQPLAEPNDGTPVWYKVRVTEPFIHKNVGFMPNRDYRISPKVFDSTDKIGDSNKTFKDMVASSQPLYR